VLQVPNGSIDRFAATASRQPGSVSANPGRKLGLY
jgi:hypothetical protein